MSYALLELEKDAPHSSTSKLSHEDVDQSLTVDTCNLRSGTERGLSMDMTFNKESGSEQIAEATKIVKTLLLSWKLVVLFVIQQ